MRPRLHMRTQAHSHTHNLTSAQKNTQLYQNSSNVHAHTPHPRGYTFLYLKSVSPWTFIFFFFFFICFSLSKSHNKFFLLLKNTDFFHFIYSFTNFIFHSFCSPPSPERCRRDHQNVVNVVRQSPASLVQQRRWAVTSVPSRVAATEVAVTKGAIMATAAAAAACLLLMMQDDIAERKTAEIEKMKRRRKWMRVFCIRRMVRLLTICMLLHTIVMMIVQRVLFRLAPDDEQ